MGIGLKENDDIEREPQNESFSLIECGNIAGSPAICSGCKNEKKHTISKSK